MTVRTNNVHDNRGTGIWFDINNINSNILGNTINNNYADGIRYEISYKALISDNKLTGNGYGLATGGGRGMDYSLYAVAAINVNSSPDVEIRQNVVGRNQNGITAQMRSRGSGTYGAWDLHNLYVHNNDVTLATGARSGEGVQGLVRCRPFRRRCITPARTTASTSTRTGSTPRAPSASRGTRPTSRLLRCRPPARSATDGWFRPPNYRAAMRRGKKRSLPPHRPWWTASTPAHLRILNPETCSQV